MQTSHPAGPAAGPAGRLRALLWAWRAAIVALVLALSLALTPHETERYGDTLEYVLPTLGAVCAAAGGGLVDYALRYGALRLTVEGIKRGSGDAWWNVRPRGGLKGMPSSHTASSVFGASSLVHDCIGHAPVLRLAVILSAGLAGGTRIDVGAHSVWQVLAGAILALLFERGGRAVLRRLWSRIGWTTTAGGHGSPATRGFTRRAKPSGRMEAMIPTGSRPPSPEPARRTPFRWGIPVVILLILTALAGPLRLDRIGDRWQIALPAAALVCEAATGQGGAFALRFALMLGSVHATKAALGGAALNLRPHGGAGGFPSAHTASATIGASSLASGCLRGSPIARIAVVLAAVFTGASRFDVGAHDLWQVLAGAAWGLTFDRAFRRRRKPDTLATPALGAPVEAPLAPWRRRAVLAWRWVRRSALALILGLGLPAGLLWAMPARAETEISVYSGLQSAPHSTVSGRDPGGLGEYRFTAGWEGRSLEPPPYYGIRAIWWRTPTLGFGLEFNHTKIYADDDTLDDTGLETLEFTDGLNLLTVNAMRRWPGDGAFTPYVGLGLGVAIPHVEYTSEGGETFEYQLAGPAAVAIAGVRYGVTDRVGVFAEYKGSYSRNRADLANGGTLDTNIVTNALNLGVSFSF